MAAQSLTGRESLVTNGAHMKPAVWAAGLWGLGPVAGLVAAESLVRSENLATRVALVGVLLGCRRWWYIRRSGVWRRQWMEAWVGAIVSRELHEDLCGLNHVGIHIVYWREYLYALRFHRRRFIWRRHVFLNVCVRERNKGKYFVECVSKLIVINLAIYIYM